MEYTIENFCKKDGCLILQVKQNDWLMLAKDVAQKWGCDPNLVRLLQSKGLLKGIKLTAKAIKYRPDEIEASKKRKNGFLILTTR